MMRYVMHTYTSKWLVGSVQISDWLADEIRRAEKEGHEILPLRSGGVDGVTDEHLFFDASAGVLLARCRVVSRDADGDMIGIDVVDFHVSRDGEYEIVAPGSGSVSEMQWDAAGEALRCAIRCRLLYSGFGVCAEEKARHDKKIACRNCYNRLRGYECECPELEYEYID